ncbi:MAG: GatB/YqeY domain-containing protein [Bacilli bacterium]|nr:GatB/YqeY domain-containing protein [Bacilli bacterium]
MNEITMKIRSEMYDAMKDGRKEDKAAFSFILDQVQKAEKLAMHELNEDEVITVLMKIKKGSQESLDWAIKANHDELKNKSEREIAIVDKFLPTMMTADEIKLAIVNLIPVIGNTDKKSKGLYMKSLSSLKGKADMKMVNQLVDEVLK